MTSILVALVLGAGAILYFNEARHERDPVSRWAAIAWATLFGLVALSSLVFAMLGG